MDLYVWRTPWTRLGGDRLEIELSREDIEAFARVAEVFPGARAIEARDLVGIVPLPEWDQ